MSLKHWNIKYRELSKYGAIPKKEAIYQFSVRGGGIHCEPTKYQILHNSFEKYGLNNENTEYGDLTLCEGYKKT